MKWEVEGADRNTGDDMTVIVEADNEASAMRRAGRQGLLCSSVRPLDPDDSMAGQSALVGSARTTPQNTHVSTRRVPDHEPQPTAALEQQGGPNLVVTNYGNPAGPLVNGWGIAAIVLGAVGLVGALIPCAGLFAAIPLGLLGTIFAVVGLVIGYNHKRPIVGSYLGGGMCIAAIVLALFVNSILATGVATGVVNAAAAAGKSVPPTPRKAPNTKLFK